MSRFAHVLKQARDRLKVPQSYRRRILLEMASDLEGSYQRFLDQGLDEVEAARRAEEVFGASDEALQLLAQIHQPASGNLSDRLSEQVGTVWSKILLVVVLAFQILLAVRVLSDRSFFVHPSPFLWPVGALALGDTVR